jgi:AraC-like DNA-binding protein
MYGKEVAMVYTERTPAAPLTNLVATLWHYSAPQMQQARQRVLPNGHLQILINLANDTIHEFRDDTLASEFAVAGAILSGLHTRYEWVDTRDLQEIVGVVFRAGGAAPFFRESAEHFRSRTLPLSDLLPLRDIRGRLQQAHTPHSKLDALETWLTERMQPNAARKPAAVRAASLLRSHSVSETAQILRCSERRLHTLMTSDIGLSPKTWSRIQRFQRTVETLHTGHEVRWEELALDCGFYDQSHFSNEFKAFAGIDPRTYTRTTRPWASHVNEA